MKIIFMLGLFFFLILNTSFNIKKLNINDLTNKTWKVDQLYSDSVSILSSDIPAIDLLRFTFNSNGVVTIEKPPQVGIGTWQINSQQNRIITILTDNGLQINETLDIVYLSSNLFVFTSRKTDVKTNKSILLEFRLIPK